MRRIGLNPDNGSGKRSDYRRMIDQANRLFTARITFAKLRPETDMPLRLDMLVANMFSPLRVPETGNGTAFAVPLRCPMKPMEGFEPPTRSLRRNG